MMRDVQSILVFGLAASSIVTAKAKNINWKILVTRTKTTANICKQMLDLTATRGCPAVAARALAGSACRPVATQCRARSCRASGYLVSLGCWVAISPDKTRDIVMTTSAILLVLLGYCSLTGTASAAQSDDCKLCHEYYQACAKNHSQTACKTEYGICKKHCGKK